MIAGNIPGETQTIPLYIYSQLETPGGIEQSLTIVVVSVFIAATVLAVGEWLDRRAGQRFT